MCFALQALEEMEHNASGMASQRDVFGIMEDVKRGGIEDAIEDGAREIEGHGKWDVRDNVGQDMRDAK